MALVKISPIKISMSLSFYPNHEPLFVEFTQPTFEELVFDETIQHKSKFFDTAFEKKLRFDRAFPSIDHQDKIKLFTVHGFVPGKQQKIHIDYFKIDDKEEGDFLKYLGFQMTDNKSVENKFLNYQSDICFNGDFYYCKWK